MATQIQPKKKGSVELRKGGQTVGLTDHLYPVHGKTIRIDEILVQGDLSGDLEYNGKILRVTGIDTFIGLEVGAQGPRGPIWKGVTLEVAA